jgi:Xaa-Pro aminopeptidase
VIAEQAYKRFYMHQTGHWLGMDVHDCGAYREHSSTAHGQPETSAGKSTRIRNATPPWRILQPGMTLTIEPGLYVRAADDVPEPYWNTGIRIEDNAIITASGCELITRDVPVQADEIEILMRDAQRQGLPDFN